MITNTDNQTWCKTEKKDKCHDIILSVLMPEVAFETVI